MLILTDELAGYTAQFLHSRHKLLSTQPLDALRDHEVRDWVNSKLGQLSGEVYSPECVESRPGRSANEGFQQVRSCRVPEECRQVVGLRYFRI